MCINSYCLRVLTPVFKVLPVEVLKNAYATQMGSEVTAPFTNAVRLNCDTNWRIKNLISNSLTQTPNRKKKIKNRSDAT